MKTYTLEELAKEFGTIVSIRRKRQRRHTIVQRKYIEGPWFGWRVIAIRRTSKGARRTFTHWIELREHSLGVGLRDYYKHRR